MKSIRQQRGPAATEAVTAKFKVEVDKKKRLLVQVLNMMMRKASQKYQAAYRPYHINPCNDAAFTKWVEMTEKILEAQQQVDNIIDLALLQLASAGDDKEAIMKALDNAKTLIEKMLSQK